MGLSSSFLWDREQDDDGLQPPPGIVARPPSAPPATKPLPLADIGSMAGGARAAMSDVTERSAVPAETGAHLGQPPPQQRAGFLPVDERVAEHKKLMSGFFKNYYGQDLPEHLPAFRGPYFQEALDHASKRADEEISTKSEALKYAAGLGERKLDESARQANQRDTTQLAGIAQRSAADKARATAATERLRQTGQTAEADLILKQIEAEQAPEKLRILADSAEARVSRAENSRLMLPFDQARTEALIQALKTGQIKNVADMIDQGHVRMGAPTVASGIEALPGGRSIATGLEAAGAIAPSPRAASAGQMGDALQGSVAPTAPTLPAPAPPIRRAQQMPLSPDLQRRIQANGARLARPAPVSSPPAPSPGAEQLQPPAAGARPQEIGEPAIPKQTSTPTEEAPVARIGEGNEAVLAKAGMDLQDAQRFARDLKSADPALQAAAKRMFDAARGGKRFKKRGG